MMRWDEVLARLPVDRPLVGVEVGVWRGELSEKLLAARPLLTLHLVDLWTEASQGKRLTGICPPTKAMGEVVDLARRYGVRAVVRRAASVDAAAHTLRTSPPVDFVFIDAKHNYSSVKEDIEAWLPTVRSGGWIGGHDYCERFAGCMQAVDEAFGSRVETGSDFTWFVRIP
jgi:hypothetical protein